MGGTGLAKDIVFEALRAGKHVVTANKALVASDMTELLSILEGKSDVAFGMEAAVCGGIPIINALQTDFLGDTISSVQGIMNGTTNFMLTKMESEGADYGAVLAEAQALGFAEADPTADVEGFDVQAKISILAKLAYGATIDKDAVPVSGISQLSSLDFEYAKSLNSTIKLIGTATQDASGAVSVYVSPTVVPVTHSLASARGSMNAVLVNSENVVESTFKGPGAGRFPTANSCVNDIIRIATDSCPAPFPKNETLAFNADFTASFYVRIKISDQLGVIRRVGELAEANNISIYGVLQNPITDPNDVDFVVTTDECQLSSVKAFCAGLETQDFVKVAPTLLVWLKE
eukprot:CAMPEP_0118872328 /NCGR_PEP_ID=MMETSP1163-20130328/14555_1 /TAXON_ID=124430 /ORGANISM="Phaeomonas parva, Strain CCMP2877" /LENGTH=345 /DNA_ID=CAMNT_0006807501 /DNA_START=6 /DNA_END=1043 /DNA_ORIENTATION=+